MAHSVPLSRFTGSHGYLLLPLDLVRESARPEFLDCLPCHIDLCFIVHDTSGCDCDVLGTDKRYQPIAHPMSVVERALGFQ